MWSLHWHCYGHACCPRGVCFVVITVLVAVTVLVKFNELPSVSAIWGLKIVCVCVCVRERERGISLTINVQLYYNSMTAVRRCILYFIFSLQIALDAIPSEKRPHT